jgi:hypothetical protein
VVCCSLETLRRCFGGCDGRPRSLTGLLAFLYVIKFVLIP